MVKQLRSHDSFSQNIECCCGLSIGVGPQLVHVFRIRHYGRQKVLVIRHIGYNFLSLSPTRWIFVQPRNGLWVVFSEFLLSKVLSKGVQTFIHPTPLTFVRIDNHREIVVTNLVDNHRNHPKFHTVRIGAVFVRATIVPTDHRILHALVFGMYRYRFVVRVLKSVM